MIDILGGNLATKIAQHCESNELIQEEVKTDFYDDFFLHHSKIMKDSCNSLTISCLCKIDNFATWSLVEQLTEIFLCCITASGLVSLSSSICLTVHSPVWHYSQVTIRVTAMSAEIQRKCGYLKQYQLLKRVQFMQFALSLVHFIKFSCSSAISC